MNGLQPGDTLEGRYRVIKALDEGGMGIVFLAEHVLIKRRVAIKVLRHELTGDADVIERFMNEARAAGTLGHPNIVESTDMGFTRDGVPYIVFEFLEGSLMTDAIYRVGGMPARRAIRIARQIASALHAAHAAGIVHRDLKIDNVFLVNREDIADHVKVLDFGVSRFLEADDDKSGSRSMIVGTPEFMAPEQITSPASVDGRADIYGLGLILYEALTARRAFTNEGDLDRLITRVLTETPAPLGLPGVPPGLEEMIFTKLLAKDPADRYQTMKEVEGALEAFAGIVREGRDSTPLPVASVLDTAEPPPAVDGPPARAALAPQTTKPRRAWPLAGAVVLGLAGAGAMYLHGQQPPPAQVGGPDLKLLQADADKLAGELDAVVQTAKLRVDGIAQTPMLRAGIETDAATMRDMARGDFLFTPKSDEVLELYQLRNEAAPVSLLRLPEDGAPTPPLTGSAIRVASDGTALRVTVSAAITRQTGGIGGSAVLADSLDLEPARQRAASRAVAITLEGFGAPIVLAAGDGTPGTQVQLPIKTSPELKAPNAMLAATLPAPTPNAAKAPQTYRHAALGLWAGGGLLLALYLVNLLWMRRER